MNDALYTDIATRYLDIDTLETQNRDELDFHAVGVWSLRDALQAAYLAGYAAAQRAERGADLALPTEQHVMLGDTWLGAGTASDFSRHPDAVTVTTAPIPEVALLESRWQERRACEVLIPAAIRERRIA